jgi:hypothetical protein
MLFAGQPADSGYTFTTIQALPENETMNTKTILHQIRRHWAALAVVTLATLIAIATGDVGSGVMAAAIIYIVGSVLMGLRRMLRGTPGSRSRGVPAGAVNAGHVEDWPVMPTVGFDDEMEVPETRRWGEMEDWLDLNSPARAYLPTNIWNDSASMTHHRGL